jgi:hypothetical protein
MSRSSSNTCAAACCERIRACGVINASIGVSLGGPAP